MGYQIVPGFFWHSLLYLFFLCSLLFLFNSLCLTVRSLAIIHLTNSLVWGSCFSLEALSRMFFLCFLLFMTTFKGLTTPSFGFPSLTAIFRSGSSTPITFHNSIYFALSYFVLSELILLWHSGRLNTIKLSAPCLWFPVKSAPSQIGPSQIGPNSNRPQVKSAPSQIGLKMKVKSAPKNKNEKRINK